MEKNPHLFSSLKLCILKIIGRTQLYVVRFQTPACCPTKGDVLMFLILQIAKIVDSNQIYFYLVLKVVVKTDLQTTYRVIRTAIMDIVKTKMVQFMGQISANTCWIH